MSSGPGLIDCLDMYLRMSAEDMKDLDRSSIILADGSGDYMGTIGKHIRGRCIVLLLLTSLLDAYHQLHCLVSFEPFLLRSCADFM